MQKFSFFALYACAAETLNLIFPFFQKDRVPVKKPKPCFNGLGSGIGDLGREGDNGLPQLGAKISGQNSVA